MLRKGIFLFPIVVLLVSAIGVCPQSPDRPTEVWPEFTVSYDPVKKVRLMFAVRKETGDETPDSTIETTATIIYRIRPIVRDILADADEDEDNEKEYMLSLAANYEHTRSFGDSGNATENKLMFDATPRYKLFGGNVLLQSRSRFEFRWINGSYDFWYRNRARVEHKFKVGQFRFIPYASAEGIWTKSAKAWNRNQLSAGVEIPIIRKRTSVDIYFLRKNCDTCSHPDVNALGFNVSLFFGKK